MPSLKLIPKNLLLLLVLLIPADAFAQISLTTENMALGGGGTAYLTGYESLFVNPANLYINEKPYSFQVSLFQGSYYHDMILPFSGNADRLKSLLHTSQIYDPSRNRTQLNPILREQIVDRGFYGDRSASEFNTQSEFYWFGLKWVKPERSYALSLRSRFANRYEIGKGYYSSTPVQRGSNFINNQSFHHRYQVLHELSFGFAESFTFLNGLIPQLSEFIIGIAPKAVLSGAYLDANFHNRYEFISEGAFWERNVSYIQQTSGSLSQQSRQFFNTQNPDLNHSNTSFRDLMLPSGMGFGLDVGITYLITFGDDLSVLQRQDNPTDQSLRLSFSITDLGAVYQFRSPYQFQSDKETIVTGQTGTLSDTVFGGSPNEHYSLLAQHDNQFFFDTDLQNTDNFVLLLPTAIHTGALFQYRRLKLMSDFSYSISKSAFHTDGLISYFGMEIRPIRFLPIRAGTRFSANLPGYYSFGTGIETNRFDLNAAIQVKNRNSAPTSEIVAASVLGLKIYIQ